MKLASLEHISFRIGVPALCLLLVVLAWEYRAAPERTADAGEATHYVVELARLNAEVETARRRVEAHPGSWMALEQAAQTHMLRAKLAGDLAGYATAETLIRRAFAIAPQGAGPFMARAQLNLSLHRLGRVEADLEILERSIVLDDPSRAAIAGMRGDVAFQRGRYDAAERHYEAALELESNTGAWSRLANLQAKTGRLELAASSYAEAATRYHGELAFPRAWVLLQLGIMNLEAMRLDQARAHFERAAQALPGWWLIEEHLAETIALQGHTIEAMARYRDIIARNENPEFMDALAELLLATGDQAEAQRWIARARDLHDTRLARFPEATAGHALAHFIAFGSVAEAVDLAERNHALRPHGESAISLAHAYARAGRRQKARSVIRDVLATRWESAALRDIAEELGLAGDRSAAADIQ